ncbi:hypothetical protein TIFTF001_022878 [Ficus carica]|uniref:Secreted protein n=1 Tax=Ficus carica TaxID=3494 RepID=A0AA88AU20_FICCA|nr:hypothetical protein TIFTF001_022878 [Ficus carica]
MPLCFVLLLALRCLFRRHCCGVINVAEWRRMLLGEGGPMRAQVSNKAWAHSKGPRSKGSTGRIECELSGLVVSD